MGYSMSSRSGWNKLEDIESAALPWPQPRNLWPFLTLKTGHAVPSSEKVVTSGVPGGLRVNRPGAELVAWLSAWWCVSP